MRTGSSKAVAWVNRYERTSGWRGRDCDTFASVLPKQASSTIARYADSRPFVFEDQSWTSCWAGAGGWVPWAGDCIPGRWRCMTW